MLSSAMSLLHMIIYTVFFVVLFFNYTHLFTNKLNKILLLKYSHITF